MRVNTDSMLQCYCVEITNKVKECVWQSFTLKDNANERNESRLSNCRVLLIF